MDAKLEEHNPWWSVPSALDDHPLIRAWTASRIRHDPGPRLAFQHDDLVYFLLGPRRVGKTTFLMRTVQNLQRTMCPQSIFYYPFEVGCEAHDVVDIVREYLAISKGVNGRRFLLLDEVSNVKGWQRAVKKLWDMEYLAGCTVIATSTDYEDVRAPMYGMPGRRGVPGPDDPLDKVLAPASFGEYVELADPRIKKMLDGMSLSDPAEKVRVFTRLCNGDVDERLHRIMPARDALELHLKNYLVSGGMPYMANELLASGTIRAATYARCASVIRDSLSVAGRDVARTFRMPPKILGSLGIPKSWRSLGRGTGVSSPDVIEDTIVGLCDSFITFVLYEYDPEKKLPRYASPKKVYFSDPYFLHALRTGRPAADLFALSRRWVESPRRLSALVEQVVADHVARLAFAMSRNKILFERAESVFYWRSRRGREVDVVFPVWGGGLAAVDVQYGGRIAEGDLRGLFDLRDATGANGGVVVTKDTLGMQPGAALVPAPLFLLLA